MERIMEESALACSCVSPEVAGPQVGFEMGRGIDGGGVVKGAPAAAFERGDVDAIAAETGAASGAEVREQGAEDVLVPAVGLLGGGGEQRGQDGAGVVVAVVGDLPRGRNRAPCDQAEGGMFRIAAAHRLHFGPVD